MDGFRLVLNRPGVPKVAFLDADKARISLDRFKGKVILVSFWASWCKACRDEMEALNSLQKALGGDGFQVVAIAGGQQVGKSAEAYLDERELDALTLFLDPHAHLMSAFETRTLPSTFLIDRRGRVLGGAIGAGVVWDGPKIQRMLHSVIEAGRQTG